MWFSIGFLFVGDFFPWLLCWFGFCLILLGVLFPIFNLKYIMREKLYYFLLLLKASILSPSSSSFYALVNDIFFFLFSILVNWASEAMATKALSFVVCDFTSRFDSKFSPYRPSASTLRCSVHFSSDAATTGKATFYRILFFEYMFWAQSNLVHIFSCSAS